MIPGRQDLPAGIRLLPTPIHRKRLFRVRFGLTPTTGATTSGMTACSSKSVLRANKVRQVPRASALLGRRALPDQVAAGQPALQASVLPGRLAAPAASVQLVRRVLPDRLDLQDLPVQPAAMVHKVPQAILGQLGLLASPGLQATQVLLGQLARLVSRAMLARQEILATPGQLVPLVTQARRAHLETLALLGLLAMSAVRGLQVLAAQARRVLPVRLRLRVLPDRRVLVQQARPGLPVQLL